MFSNSYLNFIQYLIYFSLWLIIQKDQGYNLVWVWPFSILLKIPFIFFCCCPKLEKKSKHIWNMSLALQSKIAAKRQSKDSLWGNTKGPSSKAFTFFASSYVPLLLISRFVLDKNSQWNASIFATKIDQKIPLFAILLPVASA